MTYAQSSAAMLPAPFAEPLVTGQHNLPAWARYEAALRGIFERRYYTNHGPLARQFEARLEETLGVKHAICVTNVTIGLMMALEALDVSGRVLVPGVAPLPLVHAIAWCGLEAVSCEVDAQTGHLDVEAASHALAGGVNAIVGANLWGGACSVAALGALARSHALPLIVDSSHAFGATLGGARLGRFGQIEVFSFDETNVLNASGAACVATDDDELAARLRNIRSSYGAGRPVPVVKTSNGRMSEAQAAMGLLSLDDYAANRAHNASLVARYQACLEGVEGLRLVPHAGVDASNHEALACEITHAAALSREALVERLAAFNVHALPVERTSAAPTAAALPVAASVLSNWLLLPLGARVTPADVQAVCAIITHALAASGASQDR